MGQILKTGKGNEEKKGADLEIVLKDCYKKYFGNEKEWTFDKFYNAVAKTIEEINGKVGGTQIRVPEIVKLEEAFKKYKLEEKHKLEKDEFQQLLQEIMIGAGLTGVGGVKEFLIYIFGAPVLAVFLKNRLAPTSVPNDYFIPAVTSATVFVLAKFNKI